MARVKFDDYFEGLEVMQGFIRNDLVRSCIDGRANFLVAMGIFNYIEILGSLYTGEGRGYGRTNFEQAFKNLFPEEYSKIYDQIDNLTKYKENNKEKGGAYDCVRCGMTHQYLIKNYEKVKQGQKIRFTIYGVDNVVNFLVNINSKNCGLELFQIQKNFYHLKIYNPRLIFDLHLAFENLKKKILFDNKIKKNFLRRAKEISLHLLYKNV